MSLTEFDEKKYLKVLKEEGREEVREETLLSLLEMFRRMNLPKEQILKELTETLGYEEDVVNQHLHNN